MKMSDFLSTTALIAFAPDGSASAPSSASATPATSPTASPGGNGSEGGSSNSSGAGSGGDNSGGGGSSGTSESDDFGTISEQYQLFGDGDGDESGDGGETPAESPAAAPAEEPGTKPTEPQTPKKDEPPAPQQQPETPSVDQPQPQQPQAPQQQVSPEQWAQQVQQWQDQAVEVLSTNVYNLSEEEAALIETEPAKILPKLAARVHLQTMQAAMAKTLEFVPQIVAQHLQQTQRATQFESEFYGKFPKLKGADAERVSQLIGAYRQSLGNRRPSREQLVNEVGQFIHAMMHIPLDEPTQQQPTAQTPAASQHFQPAGAGATPPARQAQPRNEFEILAAQIESGELDA